MVIKGVTYQEALGDTYQEVVLWAIVMILIRISIITMMVIKMKTTSKKRKRRHNRRLT